MSNEGHSHDHHGHDHHHAHEDEDHGHDDHAHESKPPRRGRSSFRHARGLLSQEDRDEIENYKRQLHINLQDNQNTVRTVAPRIRTDCAQEGGSDACPVAWTDCYDGMNEGGGRILKLFKILVLPDESYCDYFRYF